MALFCSLRQFFRSVVYGSIHIFKTVCAGWFSTLSKLLLLAEIKHRLDRWGRLPRRLTNLDFRIPIHAYVNYINTFSPDPHRNRTPAPNASVEHLLPYGFPDPNPDLKM